MESNIEKFYREKPIKEFNVNQTMYTMIKEESKNDMNLQATGFLGGKMTYGKLFLEADKLAKSFSDAGVKEGETVSILTISMPIVQECLMALSKIGATMAWIDLRAKEKDLIKYINNSNCKTVVVFEDMVKMIKNIIDETDVEKVIVASPKDYLSPIISILANIKDKKEGKNIDFQNDNRFVKVKDFINQAQDYESLNPIKFDKERPSMIVQSSGSTGKPKQIVHTEYNFNQAVQKIAYTDLPFYKGKTMHVSVPPFIIYGLGNSIYGSLAFTMNAEMTPYVDENTVYNDLGKFDISLAAPVHYRYIYNKLVELQKDINELSTGNNSKELKEKYKELQRVLKGIERVKAFVSGGDKIAPEELLQMERLFDKPIINGYGNNESLGATIVSPLYANRPGSIGIPMHGTKIKIVDPNTGKELKQGEIGELYMTSDNIFKYYLNNSDKTKRIKETDENGTEWVKSGDLCSVDSEGFVFHKGRNKRLIKKEAFKIRPDTIEDVILNLDYVKECVVVGVEDRKCLSVPMAFVELNDGVIFDDVKDDLKNKCMEDLPDYEVPSYIECIEKMPYTQNNKHDFRKREETGNEFVRNLNCKKLIKK